MRVSHVWRWIKVITLCCCVWGCQWERGYRSQLPDHSAAKAEAQGKDEREGAANSVVNPDPGWTHRHITEEELAQVSRDDPELTPIACREILARLNIRAPYYISMDIREGKVLKVPNDFRYYKEWTPLPKEVPEVAHVPKFILLVKDIPFLGWYERGKLVKDSQACIGRAGDPTDSGLYIVKEKDADHVSRSYPNPDGQPAPMPWALRIYSRVWIHAGDVSSGYCSPGCVVLPLKTAEELFHWADLNTVVLVVESLADMERELRVHSNPPAAS